jgi:predicted transposase YdaD
MENQRKQVGRNLFRPHSSHFFILLLDVSSSEHMKKWRLIIQEAKAHSELQRRGEGRKEGRKEGRIFFPLWLYSLNLGLGVPL